MKLALALALVTVATVSVGFPLSVRAQGATRVKDIYPGPADSSATFFTGVNGTVFFEANDGTHGTEVWKSDGTRTGTVMVKDIRPGTSGYPGNFVNVNGTFYFSADDGIHGRELWKSDGTAAGTVMVADINPGAADSLQVSYSAFTNVNGTLFFNADDGINGFELWRSDGTAAGTTMIKDIAPGANGSYASWGAIMDGIFYFGASATTVGFQSTLWRSDGTAAGTFQVSSVLSPYELTVVDDTLFFDGFDYGRGHELWKTDGTAAGTVLVKEIHTQPNWEYGSSPSQLTNVNGTLCFNADDGIHGVELWKSDGTEAGTVLVADIHPGNDSSSAPYGIVNVNGTIYFSADDGTSGAELWKSDGTFAGTVLVHDINPGSAGANPFGMLNVNGTLYFTAGDATHGHELWRTDGTSAGTVLVRDINPGAGDGYPGALTDVDGTIYFFANDGVTGFELWRLRGCGDGTLDAGEQCDDGNTTNGDGCSDACLIDPRCDIAPLSPDPNPVEFSDIEDGGTAYRYYRVTCPSPASVPFAHVLFYNAVSNDPLGEGFVADDGSHVVAIGIASDDLGSGDGGTATVGSAKVDGNEATYTDTYTVRVHPRRLDRGYQLGLGAGVGAGPDIKLELSRDLGAGISIEDRADQLDSLSGGPVTFTRRYGTGVGLRVSASTSLQAGQITPSAGAHADATLKLIQQDAFRFDDVWHDGGQALSLGAIALESAVKVGVSNPLAGAIIDHVITGVAQLDQYRTSESVGVGGEISAGANAQLGTFQRNSSGPPDAELRANASATFGLTYLAELFYENGSVDEVGAGVDLDALIDVGIAANVLNATDAAKTKLEELFAATQGRAFGLSARAVFTSDGSDLKRIELELSQGIPWSVAGSVVESALGVTVSGDESQSLRFIFAETEAHRIVQQLQDIFVAALGGGPGALIVGPAKAAADIAGLFGLFQELPYRFEHGRNLGRKLSEELKFDIPVVDAKIGLDYAQTLHHMVARGRSVGAGGLRLTEEYPEDEFGESALPPPLMELVTDVVGDLLGDIADNVLDTAKDVCDHGIGIVLPVPCAIVEWAPSDLFPFARGGRAMGDGPRFGVGGYRLFAPEGLIIAPGAHDTLVNAAGTARLDVGDLGGRVTLQYAASDVDPSWEPTLRVHRWNEGTRRWQLIGGTVDTTTHTVTAKVDRFGLYTLAPVLPTGTITWTIPGSVRPDEQIVLTGTVAQSDGHTAAADTLVTVAVLDLWQSPAAPTGVIVTEDADPATAGVQIPTAKGRVTLTFTAPHDPSDLQVTARAVQGNAQGEARLLVRDVPVAPAPTTPLGPRVAFTKATIRVDRATATRSKYALQGVLMLPAGHVPTCGTAPFVLTLSADGAVVTTASAPTLPETRPGAQWKYKGPHGAAGLANVTLRRVADGYALKLKGGGDLSALHGAELTVEVGCGTDIAVQAASFAPKVSTKALQLKLLR